MGKPAKFKTEYCAQAEKLCRLGATDADLADFFGVDESTINRWKDGQPGFCESLKAGKPSADDNVQGIVVQAGMRL